MNLRTRFALAFALVGAVVAVLVGVLSYRAASDRITAEIDRTLLSVTAALADGQTSVLDTTSAGPVGPRERGRGHDEGPELVAQAVAPDGTIARIGGRPVVLPVPDAARALAASPMAGRTATAEVAVGREAYRVLITSLGAGRGALQVAVDVDDTRRVLRGMAIQITGVSLAVLLAAAAAGWLLARRITGRLVRLTAVAEDVSVSGRVDREVPVEGHDEVGRLSASFNTMLGRLAAAREAQDRLVQDAAHELRTPLTSLRTNASVLRRIDELSPDARARLVADVQGETRELSHLVDELVELALSGGDESGEPEEPVDLAAVARGAAERVRRRTGREIAVDADATVVRGRRQALERAVGNLLENAAKFAPDGPLAVRVAEGRITVADRGPGIAEADVERIFDRFYRADAARALPGSGLGLSIVRDVALAHGGTVFAGSRRGGGAEVGFTVEASRIYDETRPGNAEVPPRPQPAALPDS